MPKTLALFSLALLMIAQAAGAADGDWRWTWTTPDYVRQDNSPTWSSEAGTATVTFRESRFSAHLENSKGDPAYNLSGQIDGQKVTAIAKPTDTDGLARHCAGRRVRRLGMEMIALLCEDGEFIGLNRPQR